MRFFLLYQYLDSRVVRHLDNVKTALWSADSATVDGVACYFLEFALVFRYTFKACCVRQVEFCCVVNLAVIADNHCDNCKLVVASLLDGILQRIIRW